MHGLGRAVLRAGPAVRPLRLYDTTVDEEGGDAHLCSRFLFLGKRLYSVRGANLRADRAFVIAITVDVSDTGFQHIIKAILQSRGTQHMAGTLGHAHLASGTYILETF